MSINTERKVRISNSQQNCIDILDILRMEGPTSRVDIAAAIGLAKPTVTIVTNEMLEKNILTEKGIKPTQQSPSRGRRKILLDINESYKLAFGVCVDKDLLSVGVVNLKGQALDKTTISIKGKEYREVLEAIVNAINTLYKGNYIPAQQILGVGICVSDGCASFIGTANKLTRLKRDLSHAIAFKIIADSTINGALKAERLFKAERFDSMMLLRYGAIIENGLWINGDIFSFATKPVGGFKALQLTYNGTSYDRFQIQCEILGKSKAKQLLDTQLAEDIKQCHDMIDTSVIILMGEYFEKQFSSISNKLNKRGLSNLLCSIVTERTLYLAGCALVIEELFDKIGGF